MLNWLAKLLLTSTAIAPVLLTYAWVFTATAVALANFSNRRVRTRSHGGVAKTGR